MSKYSKVFEAKKKQEEQSLEKKVTDKSSNKKTSKSGNPESVKSGIAKKKDMKMVNLGIKIPAWQRNYWVGKARLEGRTISSVIIEGLTEKLGEPE